MPYAAALLHGQRRVLHIVENRRHVVADGAEYEAVEQRDLPPGSRARQNPPGRQKLEFRHAALKLSRPALAVCRLLGFSGCPCDARPSIGQRLIDRLPLGVAQPVLQIPDVLGERKHGRLLHGSDRRQSQNEG